MPDNSSSNKKIAKNTLFLSIRMVIVLAISLFSTRIVLQALGVIDYGVYNVVCGFVAMFAFLNTSMSNGIQRFYNYEFGKNGEKGANKVYCTSIYIQALLAIIVVILVESLGLWYLHNKMVIPADRLLAAEWIFHFSVLSFVFGIMQAPYVASVIAHEKMDFFALMGVLDAVAKLSIAYLAFYFDGDKLVLYGMLIAAISLVLFLIYYFYSKRLFKEIYFKRGFDFAFFKNMLGFSGWNLFGTFSNVVENQGINLVLNFFFGPLVNAARGIANQINGGVNSFVTNILVPVRPQVIQSYARGDFSRVMNLTYSVSKLSGIIIVMLAIPISLEIDFILRLWLGNNIPDHTSTFTILIIATSLFNTLQSSLSAIVHATGKMKKYQLSCSIVRLMSIPLAIVSLKVYDIPEIAMSVVCLVTIVVLFISCIVVRELVGLSVRKYLGNIVLPILLVSLLSLVLLYPIHLVIYNNIARLFIITLAGIAIISIMSFYMVLDRKERELSIQMINSLKNKLNNR